jgi:hypothetical protein
MNASGQHRHEAGRVFSLTAIAVREMQRRSEEQIEAMNERESRWELIEGNATPKDDFLLLHMQQHLESANITVPRGDFIESSVKDAGDMLARPLSASGEDDGEQKSTDLLSERQDAHRSLWDNAEETMEFHMRKGHELIKTGFLIRAVQSYRLARDIARGLNNKGAEGTACYHLGCIYLALGQVRLLLLRFVPRCIEFQNRKLWKLT